MTTNNDLVIYVDDETLQFTVDDDGIVVYVDVASLQETSPTLASIAGLGSAADLMIYTTGASDWAETTITSYGRTLVAAGTAAAANTTLGISSYIQTLLNDVDAAAARSTLGVSTGSGDLVSTANLTDVANLDTARENLGIAQPRSFEGLTPTEGLVIIRDSAFTVSILADATVLFNSEGKAKRYTSINLGPFITSSGVNGLDTGAEAVSTWYYIWCIGLVGGSLAGLYSTSRTAPTMPVGYTGTLGYKGLVGAVFNDSSGNFRTFRSHGLGGTIDTVDLLSGGANANFTSLTTSAAIPGIARRMIATITLNTSSGTNFVRLLLASHGSGTTATYGNAAVVGGNVSPTDSLQYQVEFPVDNVLELMWYRTAGTNPAVTIQANGWKW